MKDSFAEQYKHPKWQKKRLEIMKRDDYTCRYCDSKEKELQIHHIEYEKGKKVWEYEDGNFLTLCKDCHKRVTDLFINLKRRSESLEFIELAEELIAVWEFSGQSTDLRELLNYLVNQTEMIDPINRMLEAITYAPKISKAGNNQ